MSGHNKWSSIKHKKGAADAKRGKIFSKLVKEIIMAAKEGGADLNSNAKLRAAVSMAKENNMPSANIEKSIKRGTGELEGVSYEEYTYEGYGQGGVAIIVDTLTDNKNRTVAEIRHVFSKYGGTMAETGAVSWIFDQKGLIEVSTDLNEDEFMMLALEAGAEDIEKQEDYYEIYTDTKELHKIMSFLENKGFTIRKAELTRKPKNVVNVDDVAEKLLKLIEKLEDCEDVQKLYANFEISDEIMKSINIE